MWHGSTHTWYVCVSMRGGLLHPTQANSMCPHARMLHATHTGMRQHVADSPYQVDVLPGPPMARHSTVEGKGRNHAVASCSARFQVVLRDAYGNACCGEARKAAPMWPQVHACIAFSDCCGMTGFVHPQD